MPLVRDSPRIQEHALEVGSVRTPQMDTALGDKRCAAGLFAWAGVVAARDRALKGSSQTKASQAGVGRGRLEAVRWAVPGKG